MADRRITPSNVIGTLLQNRVLTQETLAALTARHDPYHDEEIKFCGMPTQDGQNVFCWNDVGSVDISIGTAPQLLDTTKPYSVCITTYPIGQPAPVAPGTCYGSVTGIDDAAAVGLLNPMTITYSQNGEDFPQVAALSPVNPNAVQGMSVDPELMNEKTAVCGWGLEVINSTPLLDIGGMLTTAVVPQNDMCDNFAAQFLLATGSAAGDSYGPFQCKLIKGAPLNQADLLRYQGSMQWNAKEGVYAVVPINFQGEIESPFPCGPMVVTSSFNTSASTPNPCWAPARSNIVVGGSPVATQANCYNFLNADSVCVMLTGLNPLSTLTVRFKFFGMTIPFSNKVQIRASKPPIPWDPLFYELDTRMRAAAPFATFVKNNPGGEWWKTILGTLAELAPSVLSLIPHPIAQVASMAAKAVAPQIKAMANESKTKRKANNQAGKYGPGMKKKKTGQVVQKRTKRNHPVN
jgi:hypothetical protein